MFQPTNAQEVVYNHHVVNDIESESITVNPTTITDEAASANADAPTSNDLICGFSKKTMVAVGSGLVELQPLPIQPSSRSRRFSRAKLLLDRNPERSPRHIRRCASRMAFLTMSSLQDRPNPSASMDLLSLLKRVWRIGLNAWIPYKPYLTGTARNVTSISSASVSQKMVLRLPETGGSSVMSPMGRFTLTAMKSVA